MKNSWEFILLISILKLINSYINFNLIINIKYLQVSKKSEKNPGQSQYVQEHNINFWEFSDFVSGRFRLPKTPENTDF